MKTIQEGLTGWNLPEKIFMIIRAPYYVVSIILTVILILIFEFLGERVLPFNCDYNILVSIVLLFSSDIVVVTCVSFSSLFSTVLSEILQ